MHSVTIFTVTHHPDPDANCQRRVRDVQEAFHESGFTGRMMIVDNAPHRAEWWDGIDYHWMDGHNVYLAGAMNYAIDHSSTEFMLYFCSNHGAMMDKTFLADMLQPLIDDDQAGMTGDVWNCQHPFGKMVPHVQGGLWAARTSTLRCLRFGHNFAQCYCDVEMSGLIRDSGLDLVKVPSVRCLAGGKVPDASLYKYVHDHGSKFSP